MQKIQKKYSNKNLANNAAGAAAAAAAAERSGQKRTTRAMRDEARRAEAFAMI